MNLITENFNLIETFDSESAVESQKPIEVVELFDGKRRRLIKINLSNGGTLKKHQASEPITIFCVSGAGIFRAGENLEDQIEIKTGTLLTLEENIPHELTAEPDLVVLLTKFKEN